MKNKEGGDIEKKSTEDKIFQTLTGCLFLIVITCSIIATSYWQILFSKFSFNLVIYTCYSLMSLLIYLQFLNLLLSSRKSVRLVIIYIVLIALSILYLLNRNLNIGGLFLCGVFLLFIKDLRIAIKLFFSAVLLGTVTVCFLSIISVLPMHNNFGTIVMGFRNPNTLSYYFVLITALGWTLNWKKLRISNFIEFIVAFLVIIITDDNTALSSLLLLILTRFVFKNRLIIKILKRKLFSFLVVILPLFLTAISYIFAAAYENNLFFLKANSVLSGRLWFWNYYINNYPANLFGHMLTTNAAGIIIFPLDNAFLNLIIVNGLITYSLVVSLLMLATFNLIKNENFDILSLFIIFIITGFSENQLFIFYQCPVIILSIYLLKSGDSFNNVQ